MDAKAVAKFWRQVLQTNEGTQEVWSLERGEGAGQVEMKRCQEELQQSRSKIEAIYADSMQPEADANACRLWKGS